MKLILTWRDVFALLKSKKINSFNSQLSLKIIKSK